MAAITRILNSHGKRFFLRDTTKDFHTQFGFIKACDLTLPSGSSVVSNTGDTFTIYDADFSDKYLKLSRAPQIVPRKDIGLFITECGITKDSIVVDAGTGSGAVACLIGSIAKEVYTLEVREDHHRIACENFRDLGLTNVHASVGSIYDTAPISGADALFLDVPEPWKAVETALSCLRVGGYVCAYTPCTPQAADFSDAIRAQSRFLLMRTIEIIEREWEMSGRKVRPKSAGIGHSGFLTFARKIDGMQRNPSSNQQEQSSAKTQAESESTEDSN